eukprot:UN10219
MYLGHFYQLLLFTGICDFLCVLIMIMVTLQLLCDYDICEIGKINATKPIKPVQHLSVLSLLSFTICVTSQMCIITTLDKNLNSPSDSLFQDIIHAVNTISWAFGQLCIYLVFIINLHFTFKNTSLCVSKYMLIFLCVVIIIFFMLQLSHSVVYLLYNNHIVTQNNFGWIAAMLISATECIDFILSIILVYLFVSRLFKLQKLFPINK